MVTINGVTYVGNSVVMSNNRIIIDGKDVTDSYSRDQKEITIVVNGNCDEIKADNCLKITVSGNVGKIKTLSGDVECHDVLGDVETMSGDVDCSGNIAGKVKTMSGDVKYRK